MKTYILDIIPKLKRFSKKLDEINGLINKHWILVDEDLSSKIVFIFRDKANQLLISNNGKIEKGSWEYLGSNSLLIDRGGNSFLFKHGFIDDQILALQIDGIEEYALFINEERLRDNLNTVSEITDFLKTTYINQKDKKKERRIDRSTSEVLVSSNEFDPQDFPKVKYDILYIKNRMERMRKDHAANIIVSFTKQGKVPKELEAQNPILVDMLTDRIFPVESLRNLFSSRKENSNFIKSLEKYLMEEFKQG